MLSVCSLLFWMEVAANTVVNEQSSLGSGWQWLLGFSLSRQQAVWSAFQDLPRVSTNESPAASCDFRNTLCFSIGTTPWSDTQRHSSRLRFPWKASSSSMLVRMRSTCSVLRFTCGSISGMVACDCGLTSMTVVGFSRPVPLAMN